MLALKMSPLEMCFSPKVLVMRADTVPFPDPGGPIMTARKILWRTISGRLFVQTEILILHMKPSLDAQTRLGHVYFLKKCATRSRRVFMQPVETLTGPCLVFPCRNTTRRRRRKKKMSSQHSGSGAKRRIHLPDNALAKLAFLWRVDELPRPYHRLRFTGDVLYTLYNTVM